MRFRMIFDEFSFLCMLSVLVAEDVRELEIWTPGVE